MGRLDGKVAFVTGAAGGLGRAYVTRMAEEGAAVVAVDIARPIETVPYPMSSADELASLVAGVAEKGGRALALQADVRDRDGLEAAFREGLAEFGRIDVVVANAGIAPMLIDDRFEAWQDGIDVNLTGTFNTVQVAIPTLVAQESGSVVIISSTAGLTGIGGASNGGLAYAASKHGVVGLMRSYANNLAPHRIRVNSVHPTGVLTRMTDDPKIHEFVAQDESFREQPNALPVETVEPVDVANAVVYLASDEARYVTGVTLPVDAGFIVRR
jgi:SDR family mycofactocin-dependent oxidoreductase